jgi:hypothetical protein
MATGQLIDPHRKELLSKEATRLLSTLLSTEQWQESIVRTLQEGLQHELSEGGSAIGKGALVLLGTAVTDYLPASVTASDWTMAKLTGADIKQGYVIVQKPAK